MGADPPSRGRRLPYEGPMTHPVGKSYAINIAAKKRLFLGEINTKQKFCHLYHRLKARNGGVTV